MRFFSTAVSVALAAFAAVASAQVPMKSNAITAPIAGDIITAGEPYEIKWTNVQGSQVTLVVMDGAASSLREVRTIITNLPNTGSYTWSVPEDLPRSATYSIRISYDRDPSHYNYSDRFVFESQFVATTSAASTTSAPPTTSVSSTSTRSGTTSAETETETESSTSMRTTSTRRTTSTGEPTGEPTSQGAPPSAGTATLSSPLAVIMAVLAATLFIH